MGPHNLAILAWNCCLALGIAFFLFRFTRDYRKRGMTFDFGSLLLFVIGLGAGGIASIVISDAGSLPLVKTILVFMALDIVAGIIGWTTTKQQTS